MEPWIPFLVWVLVLIVSIALLRILGITFISAAAFGLLYAILPLLILGEYKVSECKYELSTYDTVRSCILIVSLALLVVWSTYQVFRDNKQHRFCYKCRQKRDFVAPVETDIHIFDDPEEESIASSADDGRI